MANHLWSSCGLLLSVTTLALGVAAEETKTPILQEAVVVLRPTMGQKARGTIELTQTDEGVKLQGKIRNLSPGEHGFHIHEFGDLRGTDGKAAGGHYNPEDKKHGGPDAPEHHAGDLGNIRANDSGVAEVNKVAKGLKLHFIIGRSIVVHEKADDLKSQPSGDAGARVAVGVIGFAGPSKPTKNTPRAE